MSKLKGKVAIITGGSGGIGAATARAFIEQGARVMLVDRDEAKLRPIIAELGPNADYCVADVASEADTEHFVRATLDKLGRLDVLFANAGIEGTVAPIPQLAAADFDRVMNVNVRGVFLCLKHAIPVMAAGGGGSVLITSSVAGIVGSAGLAAYVTSKHALVGLMRSAALECAPLQIRVNSIHPGPIDNRMMRGIEGQISSGHESDVRQGFTAQVPLARYGRNDEIAKLALFLASDDASYCTGGVYVADGGFTAH